MSNTKMKEAKNMNIAKNANANTNLSAQVVDLDGGKRRKLRSALKEHDFYCVKCRDHRRHTRSEKNYCHQKFEYKTKNGLVRTTYRLLSFCKVCKYKVGKFVNFETASKYPECPK
jgi:hypothetical protein